MKCCDRDLEMWKKQALGVSEEKSALSNQLRSKEEALKAAMNKKKGYDPAEVQELEQQLRSLRSTMEGDVQQANAKADKMESNMVETKHELLKVQEMLDMAEKELEKKVSQTTPFKNLKQMLQKKNDQMKTLRRRLAKYEELDD
ncbi:LZTFL1 [Bugula neritina]|uniref:Leucine zipper transcription factor-like protein 1 n=1 Tax=Bugula neritina TaxID=10212 RepID=A0A7J7JCS8_BUGNE|nr:LZTFL1 [Bugula neritina]